MKQEMRCLLLLLVLATPALAQLSDSQKVSIDDITRKILSDTGVPAASIAIVKDSRIVMAQTYGDAKLSPKVPATPVMRFKIGSITKQFTAAALLLLAEQHKLSLEDPLSRYLPWLTRASEVTLRQLLSHTSGYQDYYPLDYVTPLMARDTTPAQILDGWAKKPLDFDPGTRWQYSNTNYVIIGQIIEKITHKPLIEFLEANIFEPLGMHSATDNSDVEWNNAEPTGYKFFALGPARPAVPEGKAWLYAAGNLAIYLNGGKTAGRRNRPRDLLTPREREVVQLLAEGKSNKEIAATLGVSVHTAETHRSNIMHKLDTHSLSGLIRYAVRNKIVQF